MRRILARLAAALLLVLPLLAFAATSAEAHDTLKQTIPKDGTITESIDSVAMIFSANVLNQGAAVRVQGPSGAVSTGAPDITSALVTQKLTTPLTPGKYTVEWRVLSADGHPISGTFGFTVKGAAVTSSAASITPSSSAPTPPLQQVPTTKTNNEPTLIIVAAVLALLLIGGGAWIARSRLRDDDADVRPVTDTEGSDSSAAESDVQPSDTQESD